MKKNFEIKLIRGRNLNNNIEVKAILFGIFDLRDSFNDGSMKTMY
jgi:hypothetical protein